MRSEEYKFVKYINGWLQGHVEVPFHMTFFFNFHLMTIMELLAMKLMKNRPKKVVVICLLGKRTSLMERVNSVLQYQILGDTFCLACRLL